MNLMSAPVYSTCERSVAFSAEISWLGWPGAPGWTMGGGVAPAGVWGGGVVVPALRQDAAKMAIQRAVAAAGRRLDKTRKEYTIRRWKTVGSDMRCRDRRGSRGIRSQGEGSTARLTIEPSGTSFANDLNAMLTRP